MGLTFSVLFHEGDKGSLLILQLLQVESYQ